MTRARRAVRRSDEPRGRDANDTVDGVTTGGGPSRLVPWLFGILAAIGLVASVALVLPVTDQAMLNTPGGPATTIGRVAGLAGTYLLLITLLLIGRIPVIEHVVGQDTLVRVHRWFGPAILALLGVHVVALTVGYAQQVQTGPLREFWVMIVSYPGILMAATAISLLIVVGQELVPRRATDVAAEAQIHEEARDQDEQDHQAREQQRQAHLGASKDVRATRVSHRQAYGRPRAVSRRLGAPGRSILRRKRATYTSTMLERESNSSSQA
jgi:hypothetical protein